MDARVANHLYTIAIDPLRIIGSALVGIIPNLVFLAILIVVVRYLLTMIRVLFDSVASRTVTLKGFEPEWAGPTYRLVRMLVIVFAIVVAYPYIPGSESGALKGVSLFIGVIFSLGSSSFISNFIAGYSMTYRRAFRVGDRVKIGDHVGDVEQIRAPFVLKKELRDFYVTYEINVYSDAPQKMASLYTDLHGNILDVFNEYGIQIMVPAYESDPDQPKIVPKEHWYAAPAPSPQSDISAAGHDVPGGSSERNRELTNA